MIWLILGLVVFLGVHSVRIFAPDWTAAKAKSMGEGPWKGVYSLVSLIGLVLIVWGYGDWRPDAPLIYESPVWMKHVTLTLMLLAFLAAGISLFPAGKLKPWLKHPLLVATKIWAVAHLLANGDMASILMFGAFLVWAVLDRISVRRRGVAIPKPGPMKWDAAALIVGLALYGLFIGKLHAWLFGLSPLG